MPKRIRYPFFVLICRLPDIYACPAYAFSLLDQDTEENLFDLLPPFEEASVNWDFLYEFS